MPLIEYWWLYEGQIRRHKHTASCLWVMLCETTILCSRKAMPSSRPLNCLNCELNTLPYFVIVTRCSFFLK